MAIISTDPGVIDVIRKVHQEHRFLMKINKIPVALISDVTLPSYNVDVEKHKLLNYQINFPKRIQWSDIEFSIVEIFEPLIFSFISDSGNVSSFFHSHLESLQATPLENKNHQNLSKRKMIVSSVEIENLKPDGSSSFVWKLMSPMITKVSFGKNSRDSDALMKLSCTLAYDWAHLEFPSGQIKFESLQKAFI